MSDTPRFIGWIRNHFTRKLWLGMCETFTIGFIAACAVDRLARLIAYLTV